MYYYRGYNYRGFRTFSDIEIRHLIKSLLAIGAAFAIVQTQGKLFSAHFIKVLLISLITVGVGFVLHELAHKIVAQRYGCWAEFRADERMLVLTLILSFLGVVFAAPGAVFINGFIGRKENGIISVAGPLANIGLAVMFMLISLISPIVTLKTIAVMGASINSWIALLNMIPLWNFDGAKVLKWNKVVYGAVVIGAILLFITTSSLI